MQDFTDLTGASGTTYRFRLWRDGAAHLPIAGNYVVVAGGAKGADVLLVGATNDLSQVRGWVHGGAAFRDAGVYPTERGARRAHRRAPGPRRRISVGDGERSRGLNAAGRPAGPSRAFNPLLPTPRTSRGHGLARFDFRGRMAMIAPCASLAAFPPTGARSASSRAADPGPPGRSGRGPGQRRRVGARISRRSRPRIFHQSLRPADGPASTRARDRRRSAP